MKRANKRREEQTHTSEEVLQRLREGLCLIGLAISLFMMLALFSYHHSDPAWSSVTQTVRIENAAGKVGAYVADVMLYFAGYVGYLFPVLLLLGAAQLFKKREEIERNGHGKLFILRVLGFLLIILATTGIASLQVPPVYQFLPFSAGGVVGDALSSTLTDMFNTIGASLLLYTTLLIGITLFTGLSWMAIADAVGAKVMGFWRAVLSRLGRVEVKWSLPKREKKIKATARPLEVSFDEPEQLDLALPEVETRPKIVRVEPKIDVDTVATTSSPTPVVRQASVEGASPVAPMEIPKPDTTPQQKRPVVKPKVESVLFEPALEGTMPPLTLLDQPDKTQHKGYTNHQLEEMSRLVELRLNDFGVEVKVVAVHPGPVVTRFELQLAAGTKVSKITGLAKDLARSLSVISVRVVEVIPGKSVIGLELPNVHRETVRLSEILSSKRYQQAKSPLTLALGKDIAGHPVVADLGKMPHLLVAGTTGSGKSVGLNAMLLSLLYKATPKELRLILIDPKMLELSIYDGIPHLLTPVVTDMKDAANALRWCVAEMERRYKLMASLGVRNIAGYNAKIDEADKRGAPIVDPFWNPAMSLEPEPLQELPNIVVLADEFADMMMVVGKKVEELIARIAQKARAAGIHLILATQRPSVDVITGLIKANVPSRIGFNVSSKVDSRTILDQAGAEQLLGHGDMLYLPSGSSIPIRVHGAFVDDDEVHRVVSDLKRRGQADYLDSVLEPTSAEEMGAFGSSDAATVGAEGEGEQDPLYDEAVQIITETRRASISSIQRRLKIGYNRAARIVETMEAAGVVGPMEANGTREVLAPPPVES